MRRFLVVPLAVLLAGATLRGAEMPPPPPPLEFAPPVLLPAGRDFSIVENGAVGDGASVNTVAIQKTIDACSAAGGGTVVVPALGEGKSTFVSGALFLKKGANLRIEKGAMLKGSTRVADYPVIESRFEGIERPVMAALLNAIDLEGITVSGEGTIDGSGDQWLANFPRGGRGRGPAPTSAPGGSPAPASRPRGGGGQTVLTAPRTGILTRTAEIPLVLPGGTLMKPRLVCFTNCTNSAIKNLTLQNQAIWCLHILYCTDFLADNLQIHEPLHRIPSSDGIDIDSSKRVRVDHTTIEANDDCISIKSGKDEDGRRVNRPCEEILIVNSHMAYGQGGVAMGSEVSGMIRNVEVRDTLVDAENWAPIRFKSQPTRGGTVENIVYRNIKIANARSAFEFNLEWNMRINNPGALNPTKIKNVYLINISGNARSAGSIHGLSSCPIENILFQNCDIHANTGLRIDNALNLDTSGLKITVAQGEPIVLRSPRPAGAAATRPAP
jgi:polygalacturonase